MAMDEQPGTGIERHFADLQDPRIERARRHKHDGRPSAGQEL
jgi:hypothetical protein